MYVSNQIRVIKIQQKHGLIIRTRWWKIDQVKERVSKIIQVKEYVSKVDQLQYMRIAVDRFFNWTRSFDLKR